MPFPRFVSTLWAVLVAVSVSGAQPPDPHQPHRVLLTWTGDPATTATVTWRTERHRGTGAAEIALETGGAEVHRTARRVLAATEPLGRGPDTVFYHTITFRGLTPATTYAYRVGDGQHWSEWYTFVTQPTRRDTLQFIYLGDAQTHLLARWAKVLRKAYTDLPRADFILHAGDLINHAEADEQWGEWFAAGAFIHAGVPCVAVAGNHEYRKDSTGQKVGLSTYWQPQFNFPANGPAHLGDQSYFLDFPNARLVILNSNVRVEAQAPWLERVLRENRKPWLLVSFHHPVFSAATGRKNGEIYQHWKPLLDRYGVDLVLQGHDHVYARGKDPALARTTPVYVVSVSGPKMYRLAEKPDWAAVTYADLQLYQTVRIQNNRLLYTAKILDGTIKDQFELRKTPEGTTKLVESGKP
jgi:predicted phosphodiesterase